jgi:asparagine synthase (glutamine-hydrolysing)
LPEEWVLSGGISKKILRETFGGDLPGEVRGRGKQGFAVPVGEWFRGPLNGVLKEMLMGAGSFVREHLNGRAVERLMGEHMERKRDHTHRLFALMMLEIWAEEFKPSVE